MDLTNLFGRKKGDPNAEVTETQRELNRWFRDHPGKPLSHNPELAAKLRKVSKRYAAHMKGKK